MDGLSPKETKKASSSNGGNDLNDVRFPAMCGVIETTESKLSELRQVDYLVASALRHLPPEIRAIRQNRRNSISDKR